MSYGTKNCACKIDHEHGHYRWNRWCPVHKTPQSMVWDAPVQELEGSFAVILYFGSDKDRTDFIELVKEAKPGLVPRKL